MSSVLWGVAAMAWSWRRTFVSPGAEGCLESRVYGAGVGASNLRRRAAPSIWEVQNEDVGCRCVADAADAANGSWAATKQSDADRPMWVCTCRCSPNRICSCRDVSERREEYCERRLMDAKRACLPPALPQTLLNSADYGAHRSYFQLLSSSGYTSSFWKRCGKARWLNCAG